MSTSRQLLPRDHPGHQKKVPDRLCHLPYEDLLNTTWAQREISNQHPEMYVVVSEVRPQSCSGTTIGPQKVELLI